MSAAMLIAENVSWSPKKNGQSLLHPTSFHASEGQVLGVVGPNGAGKSTLLRMIYRYQAPSSGHICIDGENIWTMAPRTAARKVAAVLQEQPSSFGLSVREVVMLGRTPHRMGFSTGNENDTLVVDTVLSLLNLLNFENRDFATLSGGERQRVMVARALAQEPQVLVLDEPTNHLDIRHQLEILTMIRNLDLTIIISLHDLNVAANICDAILLLESGYTVAFGAPETVLTETAVSAAFRVDARQEYLTPSNAKHFSFQLPIEGNTL
jgi:iron complex transport system ATP-binding protein